jgi:hypothetical protein
MGRRGGEIGDGGSGLSFLLIRVGELNVSGGIVFVEVWAGVVVGSYRFRFISMSVLFWPCGLWDVKRAVVNALLSCFVLVFLCWLVLRIGLWDTRLLPALNTSGGGCFSVFEWMRAVVVFEDNM